MVLLGIYASQRLARRILRRFPRATFLAIVAVDATGRLVAFGSTRFLREPNGEVWARFGFLVSEGSQGLGIGTRLARVQYATAVALGVRRGGGTVLGGNTISRRVVESYGFRLAPSGHRDPKAPAEEALDSIIDLTEVVAQFPPTDPCSGGPPLVAAPAAGPRSGP